MARTSSSEELQALLGLDEEELLAVLDRDALSVITDDVGPEVRILLDLLREAAELVGEGAVRRWFRTGDHAGLLTRREFAAFEDALQELLDRGLIVRRGV